VLLSQTGARRVEPDDRDRFDDCGPITPWPPVVVLIAIVVGKPIGIALSVALSAASGLRLPENLRWNDVVAVGFAAGIGFAVALLFAVAAYPPVPILERLKLGGLLSVGSGVLALVAAALLKAGRFRVSRASPAPAGRP
jgi:NhaA family Na+:H+ antiporter